MDRVHGTGFLRIMLWRPLLAIPVEIVDVVRGTDDLQLYTRIRYKYNKMVREGKNANLAKLPAREKSPASSGV